MSNVKSVNVSTLKQWLNKNEAIVIDVREPSEHQEASIPGSGLIPIGTLTTEKLKNLGNNKKFVLHCRSGGRSTRACEKMLAEDANLDVYNLEGGITAWLEANK